MNPKTKEFIEQHIKRILDEFDFENRKEKNKFECPCYRGEKCHEIEDLNCFLCYCPEYDNSLEEGGCRINNPKGKFFEKDGTKIWDCSDCEHPHKRETAEKYLRKLFGVE